MFYLYQRHIEIYSVIKLAWHLFGPKLKLPVEFEFRKKKYKTEESVTRREILRMG